MKLFIEDLNVQGKKVIMRVDFNVPLDDESNVLDATRIEACLPSIRYVLDHGGALILMSHLGRPHPAFQPELSLKPCAQVLSGILGKPVKMAPDCIGDATRKLCAELKMGEVLLLENLRFHRAETHPDEDPLFAKHLASYAELYINDAFACAHRKHSSTYTIAQYFPKGAAAGYLLEKEIRFLGQLLQNPKRPFYAVIGGAKISSKMGAVKALVKKVDALLIGGAMAYTFLAAQGISVADSLYEKELIPEALSILNQCKALNIKLLLPIDLVVAKECASDAPVEIVSTTKDLPAGFAGYDIGPKTIQLFCTTLKEAATIFWNGPLGVYEIETFRKGTEEIAKAVSQHSAISVVGGGDSIAALQSIDGIDQITHLSTGGGATLEYIEYGTLPGIEALTDVVAAR